MEGGQAVIRDERKAQVICKDSLSANFVWVLPDDEGCPVVWDIDSIQDANQ